jgi:hypothetical protein
MLANSRAEHLASHGMDRDYARERLQARAAQAAAERVSCEKRLAALAEEREATHWWQRAERRDLDGIRADFERAHDRWSRDETDAADRLAERPVRKRAKLVRARDPLSAADLELPARAPDLDRGMDMDFGL